MTWNGSNDPCSEPGGSSNIRINPEMIKKWFNQEMFPPSHDTTPGLTKSFMKKESGSF